jgi:hypothetical protein
VVERLSRSGKSVKPKVILTREEEKFSSEEDIGAGE